jgi:phosphatidylinositol 4-kinase A
VAWISAVRAAWNINPAIAVYLTERTKNVAVHNEVAKLVRSNPRDVLDVPEALRFVLGNASVRRDLKVCQHSHFSILTELS